MPVENRRRARALTRSLSRSRYSIVVRFDIFSGHVDPPRGQTSFRADVLMTSISPFSLFLRFLAESVVDRRRFSIEREQSSRNGVRDDGKHGRRSRSTRRSDRATRTSVRRCAISMQR